jgi:hypothetical protein
VLKHDIYDFQANFVSNPVCFQNFTNYTCCKDHGSATKDVKSFMTTQFPHTQHEKHVACTKMKALDINAATCGWTKGISGTLR